MVWAAIVEGFKSQQHICNSKNILSIEDWQEIIAHANTLLKEQT
jgi:hypothetical protein